MARLGRSQPQSTRVLRATKAVSGTTYTLELSCSASAVATVKRAVASIRSASTASSVAWFRTVAVDRGGATARGLILTPGNGTYPGTDYPSGILGPVAIVSVDRGGATAGGVAFGNVTQSVTLSASTASSISLVRAASRTLSSTTASAASRSLSVSRSLSASTSASAAFTRAQTFVLSLSGSASSSATTVIAAAKSLSAGTASQASISQIRSAVRTLSAQTASSATVAKAISVTRSATSTASATASRIKSLLLSLSATSVTSASISGLETETALRGQATASGQDATAAATADRGAALARDPLANPSDTSHPGIYPGEIGNTVAAVVDRGSATAGGTTPGVNATKTLSVSSTGTVTVAKTVSKTLSVSSATSAALAKAAASTLSVTTTVSATIEELEGEPILRGGATASGSEVSAAVSSGTGAALAGNQYGYPSDLTYPGVYPGESNITVLASVDRGGAAASGNAPFVGTALTLIATAASAVTLGRDAARTLTAAVTTVLSALKAITHELVASTSASASVLEVEGETIDRGAASAAGTDASAVVNVSTGAAVAANPFGYPSDTTYPGVYPGESALTATAVVDRGGATAAGRIPNISDYLDVAATSQGTATLTAEVFAAVDRGGARAGDPLANPSDTSFPPLYPGESTLVSVVSVDRGGATAGGVVPTTGDAATLAASSATSVTVKKTVAITLSTSVGGSASLESSKYGPQTADRGGATASGGPAAAVVLSGRGSALTGSYVVTELIDAGSDSWFLAVVSQDSGFEAFDVGSEMELEALDVGSDMSLEAV